MQLNVFSKRLKELMELEGCSKRALANELGADRKSIRLWSGGAFYPKTEAMIKLSMHFKVSIDYLVGLESVLDNNFSSTGEIPIETIQKRFLETLSIYMREKNLTKYALSKKLKMDQKALTKWFTHGSMPEVATLIKLANLTDISINELLGMV